MTRSFIALSAVALLAVSGCTSQDRAAAANNQATRAADRAAGTDVSGAYPAQRDGTAVNPSGTAVSRTYDRVTGSDTSGAYPQNKRQ